MTGSTKSVNFPQAGNTLQQATGGGQDAFLAKLSFPCIGGGGPLVYTGDGRIIDAANNCLLPDTIPGGLVPGLAIEAAPGALAVRPDGTKVYGLERDSLNDTRHIVIFDTLSPQVLKVPLAVDNPAGPGPEALAVSPDGTKLFVIVHEDKDDNKGGNRSDIYVMDTETLDLSVLHSGASGQNFDGIAAHPDGGRVYAAQREKHIVTRVDTQNLGAFDIAIDPDPNVVIQPKPVVVTPDGQWVYSGNQFTNTVSVFSTQLEEKDKDINLYGTPSDLAVTPDPVPPYGHLVYVAMGKGAAGPVAVIDTVSKDVIIPAIPGVAGSDVTVSPDGTKVYVASDFVVQVIDVVDENNMAKNKLVDAILMAGGNVTAFGPEDKDGDGIIDQVDTDPNVFSKDFNDNEGGSGFIMNRWGWTVTVWDGFEGRLYAGTQGSGTQDAHIVACGEDVFLNQTDAVGLLCGSLTLEVFRGPVEVGFGVDTFISIPTGGIGRITEAPAGQFLVENVGNVALRVVDSDGN